MDFRIKHGSIPWTEIAGMRDVLIHNYFGVDYDLVWSVITINVPELKFYLEEIIEDLQ